MTLFNKNINWYRFSFTYLMITCGGFIQGMAMAVFLFPHSIPSGGSAGIAVLLNYWFEIPLSFALWFVNFSLLVAAIFWLGNKSAIGTMYAITVTSISVQLFESTATYPNSNVWIDLVVGSVILGIGVGLLLRQQVSNGGMGVLALIIAKYRATSPGKPLLLLNGSVFILTGSIIFWGIVIQAVISQFISTRLVDFIFRANVNPTLLLMARKALKK
ncbi:YitT family protein [Aquibacillus salsiterrae]|uniref:YitT family protein n=1 Tax=Aquibacillus salsiterrae TaxID=2950439 RepID=A0A9X3WB66_9BACI|nr:YitT family protein [Aquibacillus salsiterrae]MDC3416252.1 YitT family protein [Aquibacillus salsiterrae]